jgi:hypothetical protein
MTKFTEIRSNIQIHRNPHNSHASYDKIQHHHLTRRNATISQKFMDKEECKIFYSPCIIISQGGMQQYHKNSWTGRNAKIS